MNAIDLSPAEATQAFDAATHATDWTRTNLGLRTTVGLGQYAYTVQLPASGQGKARIAFREGCGGVEYVSAEASWSLTSRIVEAALAATRPR